MNDFKASSTPLSYHDRRSCGRVFPCVFTVFCMQSVASPPVRVTELTASIVAQSALVYTQMHTDYTSNNIDFVTTQKLCHTVKFLQTNMFAAVIRSSSGYCFIHSLLPTFMPFFASQQKGCVYIAR